MSFLDNLLADATDADAIAAARADAIAARDAALSLVATRRRHLAATIAEHGYGRRSDEAATALREAEAALPGHRDVATALREAEATLAARPGA